MCAVPLRAFAPRRSRTPHPAGSSTGRGHVDQLSELHDTMGLTHRHYGIAELDEVLLLRLEQLPSSRFRSLLGVVVDDDQIGRVDLLLCRDASVMSSGKMTALLLPLRYTRLDRLRCDSRP